MSPSLVIPDNLLVMGSFHWTEEVVEILPNQNQYSHSRTYRMPELSTWRPTQHCRRQKEPILMQRGLKWSYKYGIQWP